MSKVERKVKATGIGSVIVLTAVWVLRLFSIEVPGEIAVAWTGLFAGGAGYIASNAD